MTMQMQIVGMAFAIFCFVAWGTHVVWAIMILNSYGEATWGQITLGVSGLFAPPIGVIHGVMIWFGFDF